MIFRIWSLILPFLHLIHIATGQLSVDWWSVGVSYYRGLVPGRGEERPDSGQSRRLEPEPASLSCTSHDGEPGNTSCGTCVVSCVPVMHQSWRGARDHIMCHLCRVMCPCHAPVMTGSPGSHHVALVSWWHRDVTVSSHLDRILVREGYMSVNKLEWSQSYWQSIIPKNKYYQMRCYYYSDKKLIVNVRQKESEQKVTITSYIVIKCCCTASCWWSQVLFYGLSM